jgi:hypothetical protein
MCRFPCSSATFGPQAPSRSRNAARLQRANEAAPRGRAQGDRFRAAGAPGDLCGALARARSWATELCQRELYRYLQCGILAFGSSLHAQVLVPKSQRERIDHLRRYVARPAIATERLSLARNDRVIYGLRRRWRDGTSVVSLDPLTFFERLAALEPRPRAHQHTYHGVLAPAAPCRDLIVPGPRKPTTASAAPAEAQQDTALTQSAAQWHDAWRGPSCCKESSPSTVEELLHG